MNICSEIDAFSTKTIEFLKSLTIDNSSTVSSRMTIYRCVITALKQSFDQLNGRSLKSRDRYRTSILIERVKSFIVFLNCNGVLHNECLLPLVRAVNVKYYWKFFRVFDAILRRYLNDRTSCGIFQINARAHISMSICSGLFGRHVMVSPHLSDINTYPLLPIFPWNNNILRP